jgi:ribosome-associated protein
VDQNDDNEQFPPSRSARKREAEGLQKLGEQLVGLSPAQLQGMPLSAELAEAIKLAQRISERAGRRRQLQLIGKLMRQEDAEPIREALARLEHKSAAAIAEHHQAERWRERLLGEGDAAVTEFVAQYPAVDRQQLRQLIRRAQQEQAGNKPPRSARELFRLVRGLLSSP